MYKTVIVVTSEAPIPDRYELENVIVGIGNGCVSGDVQIGKSEPVKDGE